MSRRRRIALISLVAAIAVAAFLWMFPVYSVDPISRLGFLHRHASQFAWALKELAEINGGKVVALDNHSKEFQVEMGLIEKRVEPKHIAKFRELSRETAHIYAAPGAVGKKIEDMGEWEMLVLVEDEHYKRFKGLTRDEIPILEPKKSSLP